jgi:hypothetical protein
MERKKKILKPSAHLEDVSVYLRFVKRSVKANKLRKQVISSVIRWETVS